VLLICEEMNLLGGTMFALDGCKLPSKTSQEWRGTFPELHKKKQKIEAKVAQLLEAQMENDRKGFPGPTASGDSHISPAPVFGEQAQTCRGFTPG
jgi:hypothetical protein